MNSEQQSYEQLLNRQLATVKDNEKSFVDKVLSRQDSARLQKLMKTENITREELLEILYIISGPSLKVLNYNEWDRYLLGKAFAWIRDFATLCEEIIEWEEAINKEIQNGETELENSKYQTIIKELKKRDMKKNGLIYRKKEVLKLIYNNNS